MTRAEYRRLAGWNASSLKRMLISYNAWKASLSEERKPSKSMIIGTLADALLLGGEEGMSAAIEEISKGGKGISAEIDKAVLIASKARRNPDLAEIIDICEKHVVMQWSGQGVFTSRKAEADLCLVDGKEAWLYDVKTCCGNVSPADCGKQCYNFDYDLQLAWYLDGLLALNPEVEVVHKGILYISTSSQFDYDAAVIAVSDRFIEVGREKIMTAEAVYEQGLARDRLGEFCGGWPGVNEIQGYYYQ